MEFCLPKNDHLIGAVKAEVIMCDYATKPAALSLFLNLSGPPFSHLLSGFKGVGKVAEEFIPRIQYKWNLHKNI